MDTKTLRERIIFRRVIQALVIISIFLMALTRINNENDLFWQLKMGEDIVKYHYFPIHDPYNLSSPGAVWTLEEWLPSSLFYVVYTYAGPAGLIILKATIIAITFGLFMLLFNRLKVNLYLSLLVMFLAAMVNTRGIWTVFPSIFEYLFIVIALIALEYYQKSKKTFVPIFLGFFSLLWSESHGSFFLLSAITGAYLFGDIISSYLAKRFPKYQPLGDPLDLKQRKSLFIVLLVSFVTPLMTPNGYWMFLYPFRITFGKFTSYVSEYQKFWMIWSWNWSDFVHGFTVILMALLAIFFILAWRKIHFRDIFLTAIFTALAVTAVRHVAIFALVALFVLARYLRVWFGEYRGVFKRSLLKDIVVVILIVCFIFFYKTRLVPFGFDLSEDGYPKEAAELINKSGISGNMFNHYNYGGYLIWKMPKYKVFIDGRLEMYEGQAGEDYLTIMQARDGYKDVLKKYNINFFIEYLRDPIVEKLIEDSDWVYISDDGQYVVFVKNTLANQNFISHYSSKKNQEDFKKLYEASLQRFRAEDAHNYGLEALNKKDYFATLVYLQNAVNEDPQFLTAHIDLARAYLEMGLLTEAQREYESVLGIDANNEFAKTGLKKIEQILIKQNIH